MEMLNLYSNEDESNNTPDYKSKVESNTDIRSSSASSASNSRSSSKEKIIQKEYTKYSSQSQKRSLKSSKSSQQHDTKSFRSSRSRSRSHNRKHERTSRSMSRHRKKSHRSSQWPYSHQYKKSPQDRKSSTKHHSKKETLHQMGNERRHGNNTDRRRSNTISPPNFKTKPSSIEPKKVNHSNNELSDIKSRESVSPDIETKIYLSEVSQSQNALPNDHIMPRERKEPQDMQTCIEKKREKREFDSRSRSRERKETQGREKPREMENLKEKERHSISRSSHRKRSRSHSKSRHHKSSRHHHHRSKSPLGGHRKLSDDDRSITKGRNKYSRSRSKSPFHGKLTFRQKLKAQLLKSSKYLTQQDEANRTSHDVTAASLSEGSQEKLSCMPLVQLDSVMLAKLSSLPPGQVLPQLALYQTMSAMHEKAQEITGVSVPKYYNQAAVNPLKYAETIKKRKMLWTKKTEQKIDESGEGQWQGTAFVADKDGKVAAKFRKLMGIKSDASSVDESVLEEQQKKQAELFNRLDQEYTFARMTTHTQRGVGFGFQTQAVIDPNISRSQQPDVAITKTVSE